MSAPSTQISHLAARLYNQLATKRKRQLLWVLILALASAALEIISLASIVPFLTVVADPEQLKGSQFYDYLFKFYPVENPGQLVVPIAILLILAALLSALIRLLNLWENQKLSASIGTDFSCKIYANTLNFPYEKHININSSKIITTIGPQTIRSVLAINSLLQAATALIACVFIVAALACVNLKASLAASSVLMGIYIVLAITMRNRLKINSYYIADAEKSQIKALQEGLGSIRDVILDGTQLIYEHLYKSSDLILRQRRAENAFLASFPRYCIDSLALVILGLFVIFAYKTNTLLAASFVPTLGVFAFGAQRLLPSLQQLYQGISSLLGYQADLESVLTLLQDTQVDDTIIVQHHAFQAVGADSLKFKSSISFENVTYSYPASAKLILDCASFSIAKGDRVGVVGKSGSGKSTLVDILMGLLLPTRGSLMIDQVELNASTPAALINSWRSHVAHVPQHVYLLDCSIAENIALGVPVHQIDMARVRLSAHRAQLSEFIEGLPESYSTTVGERGVKLSGGQRQRIGIARALYKQSSVLILDEATSALDASTEHSLMSTINSLSPELTIVMVAHRIKTLESCNAIVKLDKGGITKMSYEQLFEVRDL